MLRILLASAVLMAEVVPAATIVVTTTDDVIANDGQCSLREAIINANHNDQSGSTDCVAGNSGGFPPTFDFIRFDPDLAGATIVLGGTQLPTVTDLLFIDGPVDNDAGGITLHGNHQSRILYAEGDEVSDFTLRLTGITLTGGRTTDDLIDGIGGAVAAVHADLYLSHVHITDNGTSGFAAPGGGVGVVAGRIRMFNTVVSGNFTSGAGSGGGGVFAEGSTTAGLYNEVIRSTISGNMTSGAGAPGGGLQSFNHLLLESSAVIGNSTAGGSISGTSAAGGGVFAGAQSDDSKIINSTVSGNFTTGEAADGGGIAYITGHGRTLQILHSTIAFNHADQGIDGILVDKADASNPDFDFVLQNSVVVQSELGETACSRSADLHPHSIATDVSCTGSATAPALIDLEPLGGHGGLIPVHALGASSSLIDAAGDCAAEHAITTDQRGLPRPFGTACDVGSFEWIADPIFMDRFQP